MYSGIAITVSIHTITYAPNKKDCLLSSLSDSKYNQTRQSRLQNQEIKYPNKIDCQSPTNR